ncbi:MAG TPA: metal ABC transporter substrate-binding protein [Dehalococcoidia bacterium]|nr:metal ABC transporter substrate-binding protein [Dehalococcoidia bacterium]
MTVAVRQRIVWFAIVAFAPALLAAACSSGDDPAPASDGAATQPVDAPGADAAGTEGRLRVVTTVAPLRSIIENIGGDRIALTALVPEGTNSHTFEPPPSVARELAEANLVIINGLNLELPTLELARTTAPEGVPVVLLADEAITPNQYVFDFSFPEEDGNPNPHLWTAPNLAIAYAEIVADALSDVDPDGGPYYAANLLAFKTRLTAMDDRFFAVLATIPESNRKLLTYHDSFPFFASRYGLEIIGAIQPSDFSEPSPREIAGLVRQLRDAAVPAIFGSEVFPSEVLDIIAVEAGAVQVSSLRDDDLPGDPGDPENTFVAMMVENVRTMATVLGGDAAAMDGFDVGDTWTPYTEFLSLASDE